MSVIGKVVAEFSRDNTPHDTMLLACRLLGLDDFKEEQHPRGPDGKFAPGGGGGSKGGSSKEVASRMTESGRFTKVDLKGVDDRNAQKIETALNRMVDDFPFLKGQIGVDIGGADDEHASCEWYGDGTIHLNADSYKDNDQLKKDYAISVKENESPKDTDESAIIYHETAHRIDGLLSKAYRGASNASSLLRARTLKALGLKTDSIPDEVCSYAATDAREWFAECLAEAYSSPHPRRMATECMRQLALLRQQTGTDAFREEQHPRGPDGRFTAGGGSGKKGETGSETGSRTEQGKHLDRAKQQKERKFNQSSEALRPKCFESDMKVMEGTKRIEGDHSWDDDAKKTNPGYWSMDLWDDQGKSPYTINCQRCVVAYEARRRGFDVEADPVLDEETQTSAYEWQSMFGIKPGTGIKPYKPPKGATLKEIHDNQPTPEALRKSTDQIMLGMGSGARAVISCDWKKSGGHVFIAENHNGVIRYIDPQTGETDASDCFDRIFPLTMTVHRIDDKPFTDQAARWCVNR